MCSAKLKEDLKNCLITFDRRIVITELLDDYDLPYEEVNSILLEHLKQQENNGELKYQKHFLVHGVQENAETRREIYKIVEEKKLKEWLKKLKNAESSLYSVEVAGGAKAAAPVFKPMKVKEGVTIKERVVVNASQCNGGVAETSKNNTTTDKKDIKMEAKNLFQESSSSKANKDTTKVKSKPETPIKKTPPKTESSPSTKKSADKKATTSKKGSINSFFGPAANKKKDSETKDNNKPTLKPPTPKKMNDFFKKQTEKAKPAEPEPVKQQLNNSIQLFETEDEEKDETEEVSSDEEEKIEALKRDIISSDVEMEAVDEEIDNKPSTSAKRRRILDSDDEEEDPPIKQEKLEAEEEIKEEVVAEAETYLDEEGFVITKKPKQKPSVAKPAHNKTKTAAVTLKTPPKENKKTSSGTKKDNKTAGNPAAKTKQAGIMNFFSKK